MRACTRALPLVALALILAATAAPAAAQAQRCFAETGQCIAGPIRAYWEQQGGLAVFGFPLGPQREELVEGRALQVQWFERDRLELQPDGRVSAGRLGVERLEQLGTPWAPGANAPAGPGCSAFPETGHQICGPFAAYWRANGGLARFGLPVTGEFETVLEGRALRVQYFERRRFELHGTTVLLGLLGSEVAAARAADPAPAATPAPPPPAPAPTAAPQPVAAPPPAQSQCHPSYPDVCIPPPPPDLDCGDIPHRRFRVIGSDPHRFDGDNDGIGCER